MLFFFDNAINNIGKKNLRLCTWCEKIWELLVVAKPPKAEGEKSGYELEIWLLLLLFSEKPKSDAEETVKLENVFMR